MFGDDLTSLAKGKMSTCRNQPFILSYLHYLDAFFVENLALKAGQAKKFTGGT